MSKILSKAVYKIIVIVIIIALLAAFRESLLTDSNLSEIFGSLLGQLPFAKLIYDTVTKVLGCRTSFTLVTSSSLLTDFLRLAVMALIKPLIIGLLMKIFLPLPSSPRNQILMPFDGIDAQESYMDSLGYKLKSLLLTVITSPFLAILASWLTAYLFQLFTDNLGTAGTLIMGSLSVLLVAGISILPLVIGGTAIGVTVLWRLLVTLLTGMANTFMTNLLCMAVYVAFIGGIGSQMAGSIVALVLWLILFEAGMKLLKMAIVS